MKTPKWYKINEETTTSMQYKYPIAIKNMYALERTYGKTSIYISKPTIIDSMIKYVYLVADDHNVLIDQTQAEPVYGTSIEYDISINNSDFKPILPKNIERIYNELLFVEGTSTLPTRFAVDTKNPIMVYKNGKMMDTSKWVYLVNGTISIMDVVLPSDIFTVTYTPNFNQENIKIFNLQNNKPHVLYTEESFDSGTDHNGGITLAHTPIPNTLQVSLLDFLGYEKITTSGATKDRILTQDITLADISLLNRDCRPFDKTKYPKMEYILDENNIYFPETFAHSDQNLDINHGDATIVAKYQYFSNTISMRIILRNNVANNNGLTPIVKQYSLNILR